MRLVVDPRRLGLFVFIAVVAVAQPPSRKMPPNLFPVKAVPARPAPGATPLRIAQSRFFSYALPEGWRVGEDGQYALTLVAPDSKALTIMTGNSGFPPNYSPARFVQEKLMALRPENLRIGPP